MTFYSKKDSTKRYTFDLPFEAQIQVFKQQPRCFLFVAGNDSIITAKKNKYGEWPALTNEGFTVLSKYERETDSIRNNQKLTREEKLRELDTLEKMIFKDTIILKTREVQKIKFMAHPSKIIFNTAICSFGLFGLMSMSLILPLADNYPAKANVPFVVVGLAGLALAIPTSILINHIKFHYFRPKKWHIATMS